MSLVAVGQGGRPKQAHKNTVSNMQPPSSICLGHCSLPHVRGSWTSSTPHGLPGLTQQAVDAMQPAISSLPGWQGRRSSRSAVRSALTTGEAVADADAVAAEPPQLKPLLNPIVASGSSAGAPASPTAMSLFSVRVTGKSSALTTAASAGEVQAAAAAGTTDLINLDSAPLA
jgi:hypothetical protein